jgi:predicted Zn-dependent protease
MDPIDELLSASRIERSRFILEVEEAFQSWEEVADIRFRRIADPAIADIKIGAQATPKLWAFADVAYTAANEAGAKSIDRALICLNPARRWAVDFEDGQDAYQLGYVLMHEAGHAIGLDHSGSHDQVMSYRYPKLRRGLQSGDIQGAISLYGEYQSPAPKFSEISVRAIHAASHRID